MAECEHIIGFLYDYENTDVVTIKELKEYIEDKETIKRFNYCPKCGKEIDWSNLF